MTERGCVSKIKGKKAVVRFDRRSACDSCHMCSVSKDGMKVEVTVENTAGASVGDFVEIKMADRFVLSAAAMVYLIPLVLTAIGIGIGSLFSVWVQLGFALGALAIGVVIVFVLEKTVVRKKKNFAPEMVGLCTPEQIEEMKREKIEKENAGNAGIKTKSDSEQSAPTSAQTATNENCSASDCKACKYGAECNKINLATLETGTPQHIDDGQRPEDEKSN